MSSLMFVTMDGGGNVPPLLETARACQAAGHAVTVHGHPRLAARIHQSGLGFQPFLRARPWDARRPQSSIDWLRMFNDGGIGADVADAYRRDRPDLAVIDCMLLGAHQSLAEAGASRVVLTHTVRAYLDGTWRRVVGSASRLHGHDVGKLWGSAAANVVVGYPPLDVASGRRQPANVTWTGAITGPARAAVPGDPPHVLVSLSTNAFRGMHATLQRIVDALGTLPVTATVTTGEVYDPRDFAAVAGVRIVRYGDHSEIMPTCSLVIGHGGYSTTVKALAHGLPLLLIPANSISDQPLVCDAVARLGAGIRLRRCTRATEIARAVRQLLTDPRYRERATSIGADIRATDGAKAAATAIADVLA